MTSFTGKSPGYTYGDVLTTTNNGQGLTNVLKNLQDGVGNNSTITIATNAINFNRTGGNTFQLDGSNLTSDATDINNVCTQQIFTKNIPLRLPIGTTAQRPPVPSNGDIWYNTDITGIEAYSNGAWVTIT